MELINVRLCEDLPNFNVAIEDFNGYFGWLSDEEDSEV